MSSEPRSSSRRVRHGSSHAAAAYLVIGIAFLLLPAAAWGTTTAAHPSAPPHPVAGTPVARASVLPAGTRGALYVTIVNNADAPTATYQQEVVVDSEEYAALINSNWSNGAAYYAANGTPIYLWLESGATNVSTQTVLWLRLYPIPANGEVVVALTFAAKSTFLLSEDGFSGESPLLSSTYGEFDNGWRVFNFYDNFSGTSLSGKWTTSGSWTYSVDNGIGITGIPGSGGYISSLTSFAFPETVDFYGDLYETISATAFDVEGIGTSGCTSCGTGASLGYDAGGGGALDGPTPWVGVGSYGWWNTPVLTSQTYATFTVTAVDSDEAQFFLNYTDPLTELITMPGSPEPVGLAMSGYPSGTATNTEQTYWIRERTPENTSVTGIQAFGTAPTSLEALPGTLDVGQSLTLEVSVGDWPPVTYSYSGLPSGCASVDLPTLSCVVTTVGQCTPTVTISAGLGVSITASTNVTVALSSSSPPPAALGVLLAAVPSVLHENESLTLIASASGGTAPMAFSYAGLPPGCTTQDRFYVSCAPSTTGNFTVTVTVTDTVPQSANASAEVMVLPAAAPAPTPPSPLAVSLTSYDGTLSTGSPLLLVASVSGGIGPFSFVYSGLPGGCSSANVSSLSCIPTATGSFTVSVVVSDTAHTTATASTLLTLAAPPTPTTSGTTTSSGLSTDQGYELAGGIVVAVLLAVVAIARSSGRGRGDRSSPPPSG